MPKLIVSIVVHRSSLPELGLTLHHLFQAGSQVVAGGLVAEMKVCLVDNASGRGYRTKLSRLVQIWQQAGMNIQLLENPDNIGFSRGHNRVETSPEDWRLVLNPDVFLQPDSLVHALRFSHQHPEVGVVVPRVTDGQGKMAYLCKRYPSVLVLFLRGFAPVWLRALFSSHLMDYEMREMNWECTQRDLELVSGCCLLIRGQIWQETSGFCPAYFLYFEDFDFSLRAGKRGEIAYVPAFTITHLGGDAARKGWRHRLWFIRSAWLFFHRHGWRWI